MFKLETALLHVRGLQDNSKTKRIFQTLRNWKFDIILLQETHSTDEHIVLLKKDLMGCAITQYHQNQNSNTLQRILKER